MTLTVKRLLASGSVVLSSLNRSVFQVIGFILVKDNLNKRPTTEHFAENRVRWMLMKRSDC